MPKKKNKKKTANKPTSFTIRYIVRYWILRLVKKLFSSVVLRLFHHFESLVFRGNPNWESDFVMHLGRSCLIAPHNTKLHFVLESFIAHY